MTGTEETLSWLNESLQQYFVKEALLKHTALSEITVYRHRSTDMKLLVRRSRNRNDEVYRLLLTARLPHLPQIYEVISTPEELIVLEEYLEGEPLAARLESGRYLKHMHIGIQGSFVKPPALCTGGGSCIGTSSRPIFCCAETNSS